MPPPAGGEGMTGNRVPRFRHTVHIGRWRTRPPTNTLPGVHIMRHSEPASWPSPLRGSTFRSSLDPDPSLAFVCTEPGTRTDQSQTPWPRGVDRPRSFRDDQLPDPHVHVVSDMHIEPVTVFQSGSLRVASQHPPDQLHGLIEPDDGQPGHPGLLREGLESVEVFVDGSVELVFGEHVAVDLPADVAPAGPFVAQVGAEHVPVAAVVFGYAVEIGDHRCSSQSRTGSR